MTFNGLSLTGYTFAGFKGKHLQTSPAKLEGFGAIFMGL